MPRVLVLWQQAPALSASELESWAREEAGRMERAGAFDSVRLARLETAPCDYAPSLYQWLLELRLDGRTAAEIVRDPALMDLLGDLRLLGAHPTIAVTG